MKQETLQRGNRLFLRAIVPSAMCTIRISISMGQMKEFMKVVISGSAH